MAAGFVDSGFRLLTWKCIRLIRCYRKLDISSSIPSSWPEKRIAIQQIQYTTSGWSFLKIDRTICVPRRSSAFRGLLIRLESEVVILHVVAHYGEHHPLVSSEEEMICV
jgi:hypothetical protein